MDDATLLPGLSVLNSSFQRPNNTTAYAQYDLIAPVTTGATAIEITDAVRVEGDTIRMEALSLRSSNPLAKSKVFRVHVWLTAPTLSVSDNGVFDASGANTLAVADIADHLGSLDITLDMAGTLGAKGGAAFDHALMATPPSGTSLWWTLELQSAAGYTPLANETFQLDVEGAYLAFTTGDGDTDPPPEVDPPTDLVLDRGTDVAFTRPFGSTLAFLACSDPDATYSIVGASSWAEVSGAQLRLLDLPGALGSTQSLTLRASNSAGDVDVAFTFNVVEPTFSGEIARWRADTGVTMDGSNRVSDWVDMIGGFTLSQATTGAKPVQGTGDNSRAKLSFTPGSSQMLTSNDAALIGMLDVADTPFTIVAAVKPSSFSTVSRRTVVCLSSASRELLWFRQANNSTQWGVHRGSDTQSVAGGDAAFSPAPSLSTMQFVSTAWDASKYILGFDKQYGPEGNTFNDAAATGAAFSVGGKSVNAANGYWDGEIYEIRVFNRRLGAGELDAICDVWADYYAHTVPAPTYMDLTGYSQVFEDEFEALSYQRNDTINLTSASAWRTYGKPPANVTESQYFVNPDDPDVAGAGYNPFKIKQGTVLAIGVQPKPVAIPDAYVTYTASSVSHTQTAVGGRLDTLGWPDGMFQYGYLEARCKVPPGKSGNWPAWWTGSAMGNWPPEIDMLEQVGTAVTSVNTSTHTAAPNTATTLGLAGDVGLSVATTVDDLSADFHLFGVDWQPDHMKFYYDRKLIYTVAPRNGVAVVAITGGGSGITADNGTSTGDLKIQTSGGGALVVATGVVTITSGVATAVTLSSPGQRFTGSPSWVKRPSGSALPGGMTLSTTLASDPNVPLDHHIPQYMILNMALGGSWPGAPDLNDTDYPREFLVDYVKVYQQDIVAPTLLTGTQGETTALLSAYSSASFTPGGTLTTAINDFICAAKSWELRFDTDPHLNGVTLWDTSKLTLWDAIEAFYFAIPGSSGLTEAASYVNWKSPGTHDLAKTGSVTFGAAGWTFPGTAGAYLSTGIDLSSSPVGVWRSGDHAFGGLVTAAPTNGSNASLWGAGSGQNLCLKGSAAGSPTVAQHGFTSSNIGWPNGPAIGTGHYVSGRRMNATPLFKDGVLAWGSKASGSGAIVLPSSSDKLLIGAHVSGTAGAAFSCGGFHLGRYLMPAEVEKLAELVATLKAAF